MKIKLETKPCVQISLYVYEGEIIHKLLTKYKSIFSKFPMLVSYSKEGKA